MSDQKIPVEIFTEATCEIEMLSSLLPNRRLLTRLTRSGLTTMRVGNHKSFDQFRDFEDRGERFRALVQGLSNPKRAA